MSIALTCACGRRMKVVDAAAGKRVRCPQCRAVLPVPMPVAPSGGDIGFRDEPPPTPSEPVRGYERPKVECWACHRSRDAHVARCPFCGAAGRDAQGNREGSLWSDAPSAYGWALKGTGALVVLCAVVALVLVVSALVAGFISVADGGAGRALIWAVMIWYSAFMTGLFVQIVKGGAIRMEQFPDLPTPFELSTFFPPFLRVVGWSAFAMAPALLLGIADWFMKEPSLTIAAYPVAAACAPFWLLGVLGACVHDTLFGLSPVGIVRSFFRAPGAVLYALLMMALGYGVSYGSVLVIGLVGVALLKATGSCVLALLYGIASWFVILVIQSYVLSAQARVLGVLHYHRGDRFELARPA